MNGRCLQHLRVSSCDAFFSVVTRGASTIADRRRSVAAVWRSVAPPRVVVVARTALPHSRVEPWSRSRSRKSPSPVDPRSVAMCEVSFALDRARRRRARAPRRVASTRAVATRESRRVGYAVDTTHRNDARGRRTREGAFPDARAAWGQISSHDRSITRRTNHVRPSFKSDASNVAKRDKGDRSSGASRTVARRTRTDDAEGENSDYNRARREGLENWRVGGGGLGRASRRVRWRRRRRTAATPRTRAGRRRRTRARRESSKTGFDGDAR